MILASFRAGLREIFTLRDARATAESYGERLAQVRLEKGIARARLLASRRLSNPFVALDLLSVAADHTRRAWDLEERSLPSPLDPPPRDAVATFAQAEATRDDVEANVAQLLSRLESRTQTELLGLRIGRLGAIAVVLVVLAWTLGRHFGVHDVALNKPVITSGLRQGKAEAVVDGRTRGTFALQTAEQAHPFVMIDLGRMYRIRSIRIYNRGDGWFDEVLPLSVELSSDGTSFHEIARRTEHFDVWTLELGSADARFVRVSKENGYIALNEIEVYSRE
jgi:hypothetical protein